MTGQQPRHPDHCIRDGDYAVFDVNGDKMAINHIHAEGKVKVGKCHVPVKQLVGAPWGSVFELGEGGILERVKEAQSNLGPAVAEVSKDNRELCDNNDDNQALKAEDIAAMKEAGRGGADIIEALCAGSLTFETKTEFAQDKYKKRKSKKYMSRVTLRRPTARAVCEVLFSKGPQRVWNLRHDSLAILLSLANVSAHARVLVIESCQGLVTAACAERMGGLGQLCACGLGDKLPPVDVVRLMNLTQQQKAVMCQTSLSRLQAAKGVLNAAAGAARDAAATEGEASVAAAAAAAAQSSHTAVAEAAAPGAAAAEATAPCQQGVPAPPASLEETPLAAALPDGMPLGQQQQQNGQQNAQQQDKQQQEGQQGEQQPHEWRQRREQQQHQRVSYTASEALLQQLVQPGFNSCIIAAPKAHTVALMQQVMPLLAPSASFVVYSPWQQPLAECWQHLASSKQAVLLQLQESWLRPYQVLPGRTHPHMMTTGTGGYLLSGTTVMQASPGSGAGRGGAAKRTDDPGDRRRQKKQRT